MIRRACVMSLTVALCAAVPCVAAGPVHHQLQVQIQPDAHTLQVLDRVSFRHVVSADENGAYRVLLHAGLSPRVVTPGWRFERLEDPVEAGFFGINATTETVSKNVPLEAYVLTPRENAEEPVEFVYGGEIHHPLAHLSPPVPGEIHLDDDLHRVQMDHAVLEVGG